MKPNDPSEQQQGPDVLTWPEGVAAATGASTVSLQRRRAAGDAPKLYAVTERRLVTTRADLLEWIRAKSVPPGYKCRPSTAGRRGRLGGGEGR